MGQWRFTLTVIDEGGLASVPLAFNLVVLSVNDAPTINSVADINIDEDAPEQTLNLTGIGTGGDAGQTVTSVTATVFEGAGIITITQAPTLPNDQGATTLKFRPVANQNGTAKVRVTVTDSGNTDNGGVNTTSIEFKVIVRSINDLPVVGFSRNETTGEITGTTLTPAAYPPNTSSPAIPFYIKDVETSPNRLSVTAVSQNPAIVPNTPTNIQIGGQGTQSSDGGYGARSLLVTPAPGASGTATILITVTDADNGSSTLTANLTWNPGVNPNIVLSPTTQTIHPGQFTDLITIVVSDPQTPAAALSLSGVVQSTTNPLLIGAAGSPVSSGNLQFGGSGANRAMIIYSNPNQTGTAVVRVTVTDADTPTAHTAYADFTLVVLGDPPTISSVANQTVEVNKSSTPATFTVNDKETFPGFLVVTGTSSDQTVIRDDNIYILGTTTARSVSVVAGSKAGNAVITLTVKDAENQTASTTFVVTVTDNTQAPTVTTVGSQSTQVNKPTSPITFIVGDKETPVALLTLVGTSGNTALVPNANIAVFPVVGNAAARNVIITPATDKTGTALITMTVTDTSGKTGTSTFTLTVSSTSVPNDFNGDRAQDIVLQDVNGFLGAWFMSGDDMMQSTFFTPNNVGDAGWKVVGCGDFTGDGKPDLLFQHTDGSLAVWALNGVVLTGSAFTNPSNTGRPDWKAAAVGDFNKDGKVDILFQNDDGSLAIWYMDGVNLTSVANLVPNKVGKGWTAFGVGDFNGDGNLDIVFQADDGTLGVWYLMNSNNLNFSGLLDPSNTGDPNWRAVGVIDLNGDSKPDLLLQNRATTDIGVWYMNGPKLVLGKLLTPSHPGGTWKVVAP